MPSYLAPTKDLQFVLHEVLNVSASGIPGYDELEPDFTAAVLEEAGKIATEVLAPLNAVGDREGCTLENGIVHTPTGFKDAYDQMCEGGWLGLDLDPDFGGQGMPYILGTGVGEIFVSANMAFNMYMGLTHGAYSAIHAHGSDAQKATYLTNMAAGKWAGTMNLTEPHCGTDLGLMRTRAEPHGDGSYQITGTKIFISAGDQDLTENVIHLVLAKAPGGGPGTKGISLFIVPKFLVNDDGSLGARNGVSVGNIEEKMGIHGNSHRRLTDHEAKQQTHLDRTDDRAPRPGAASCARGLRPGPHAGPGPRPLGGGDHAAGEGPLAGRGFYIESQAHDRGARRRGDRLGCRL